MTKTVEEVIIGLMQDFVDDWGLDDLTVTRQTKLKGDVGFDSSDTMQLFAAIQEHYAQTSFTFQNLVVQDDKFVDDLTVGQVIVFVIRQLSGEKAA